jgi:hypothetical protein
VTPERAIGRSILQTAAKSTVLDRLLTEIPDMSTPKLNNLASLAGDAMKAIDGKAAALAERIAKLNERSDEVFGKWHKSLDGTEKSISAAEDALNRLSNGAPTEEDSSPSTQSSAAAAS